MLYGPLPIEVRCGWTPQHDDFDRVASFVAAALSRARHVGRGGIGRVLSSTRLERD
jgi:hypothetical protein